MPRPTARRPFGDRPADIKDAYEGSLYRLSNRRLNLFGDPTAITRKSKLLRVNEVCTVDTGGGTVSLTLPRATVANVGSSVIIYDYSQPAGTVNVLPSGGDKINRSSSSILSIDNTTPHIFVCYDASHWLYWKSEVSYVEATEVVPRLSDITGSNTATVDTLPGHSSTSLLRLSDGNTYTDTMPVTIDLSTNGLGGLEGALTATNDTWYYVYAVPAAGSTSGVVVSDQSPIAGGPANHSVYRYLFPLRYGTGAIVGMFQYGDEFLYSSRRQIVNYNGSQGPQIWTALDLSSFIPATCTRFDLVLVVKYQNTSVEENVEFRRTGDTSTQRLVKFDTDPSNWLAVTLEHTLESSSSQSIDHKWSSGQNYVNLEYELATFKDQYVRV